MKRYLTTLLLCVMLFAGLFTFATVAPDKARHDPIASFFVAEEAEAHFLNYQGYQWVEVSYQRQPGTTIQCINGRWAESYRRVENWYRFDAYDGWVYWTHAHYGPYLVSYWGRC